MTKPSDEILDPVVIAALIEDPDDEETPEGKKPKVDEADGDEDADKKEKPEEQEGDDPDDAGDKKEEPKKPEEKAPEGDDKPAEGEAGDDAAKTPEEQEKERQTRKEKREARRQEWLKKIAGQGEKKPDARSQLFTPDPNYKPLNYDEVSEVDPKVLAEDRDKFGRESAAKIAAYEQFKSEQIRFWDKVEHDNQLLALDPKLQFLNVKNESEFDEDRAGRINELYLQAIGYQENQVGVDAQNKPVIQATVARTDLPYAQFVRDFVELMEDFAEEGEARTTENIVKQKASQGIRPGGGSKKSLGNLQPGDISKMSDEEFEKNEAEIDRQILAQL